MQFHACHLGEAHPIFLKTLAAAVDGHFHTFSDVANIARELNANLVASTAQVTILGTPLLPSTVLSPSASLLPLFYESFLFNLSH